jgi:hypothetical protein
MDTDLFGGEDFVCSEIRASKPRQGVNWASFHPTLPLIKSGLNDRQVHALLEVFHVNPSIQGLNGTIVECVSERN